MHSLLQDGLVAEATELANTLLEDSMVGTPEEKVCAGAWTCLAKLIVIDKGDI